MLLDKGGVGRESPEIRPRAEDLVARAGEDDCPHCVVIARLPHRIHERRQQLAVEGVALIRPVQGDGCHPVLDVVEQLVGHRATLVDLGANGKCYVLLPTASVF